MSSESLAQPWLLAIGGKNNLGLIPHNLDWFKYKFECQPMLEEWNAPTFEISGKSKKLRDFVSWVSRAPLVSERAMQAIRKLCGQDIEFLPFHSIKGKPYWVMNVLRLEDIVDLNKCNASIYGGKVVSISEYVFKEDRIRNLHPIFKVPEVKGDVFVSQEFANMVIDLQLTGLSLADPKVNNFVKVARGESVNVVNGVVE